MEETLSVSNSMKFRPGDTVRIPGERDTAKIRAVLMDVNGALLETAIGGRRNWNLSDLRLVERTRIRRKKRGA